MPLGYAAQKKKKKNRINRRKTGVRPMRYRVSRRGLIDGRVADARVPDRSRWRTARRRAVVGVAESICADVSWRHLLVQSSELRAFRLWCPGPARPGPSLFRSSLSRTSHLRLLSGHPVDAMALFTLTRITITLVRVHPARCRAETPIMTRP